MPLTLEELLHQNKKLAEQNLNMKEELRRLYGVDRPFICGQVGDISEDGTPEFVLVSPSYGSDKFSLYKKFKDSDINEER